MPRLVPHNYRLAREFKVVCLRESYLEDALSDCDNPPKAVAYWRANISTAPHFNAEVESLYVLMLNARRAPKGHTLIAQGTLDRVLCHPRETFRAAIITGASAIVVMHNHPSGDPTPSESDIKLTRDLIRGGEIVQIQVLDHVIVGRPTRKCRKGYSSLRELGYFYSIDDPLPPLPAGNEVPRARPGDTLATFTNRLKRAAKAKRRAVSKGKQARTRGQRLSNPAC